MYRNRPTRPYDPTKEIRFSHSPFSFVHFENDKEKLEASCSKEGKITITHVDKLQDVEDVVVVPASLIFKISEMLNITRKVKYQDRAKANDTTPGTTEG